MFRKSAGTPRAIAWWKSPRCSPPPAARLEKIAAEVYRLATTEYGEVEEPFFAGKVGSSTMPHKRNNVMCEAVISCGRAIRAEASVLFDAQIQEHERHSGLWKTEWIAHPQLLHDARQPVDQGAQDHLRVSASTATG